MTDQTIHLSLDVIADEAASNLDGAASILCLLVVSKELDDSLVGAVRVAADIVEQARQDLRAGVERSAA